MVVYIQFSQPGYSHKHQKHTNTRIQGRAKKPKSRDQRPERVKRGRYPINMLSKACCTQKFKIRPVGYIVAAKP